MSDSDVRHRLSSTLDRLPVEVDRSLDAVAKRAETRERRSRVLAAVVALAIAGAGIVGTWRLMSLGGGEPRFRAGLPRGMDLVFDDARDGDAELYRLRGDGRLIRLTDNGDTDAMAAWSPDGERIAFMSDRDGDRDIYVMNADGTDVRQLTNGVGDEDNPSWAPDGRSIAFNSWNGTLEGDGYDLFVLDLAAGVVQQVDTGLGNERFPAWSPDGKHIAFSATREFGDPYQIYVIDVRDGSVRRVTDLDVSAYLPAWSPDGSRIAFESERDWLYLTDLSGELRLIRDAEGRPVVGATVAWSPSGRWLAFSSTEGLYLLDVNERDSSPVRIAEQGVYGPSWRPRATATVQP